MAKIKSTIMIEPSKAKEGAHVIRDKQPRDSQHELPTKNFILLNKS